MVDLILEDDRQFMGDSWGVLSYRRIETLAFEAKASRSDRSHADDVFILF